MLSKIWRQAYPALQSCPGSCSGGRCSRWRQGTEWTSATINSFGITSGIVAHLITKSGGGWWWAPCRPPLSWGWGSSLSAGLPEGGDWDIGLIGAVQYYWHFRDFFNSQSICFFLVPIISSVAAVHTALAQPSSALQREYDYWSSDLLETCWQKSITER